MRRIATSIVIGTIVLVGCGKQYDAAGLTGMEKDGRIYLFAPNSPELEAFKQTGKLEKGYTAIGAGPNGETVKAPEREQVDRWLEAMNKK